MDKDQVSSIPSPAAANQNRAQHVVKPFEARQNGSSIAFLILSHAPDRQTNMKRPHVEDCPSSYCESGEMQQSRRVRSEPAGLLTALRF